jgi:erythromycin esterase
LLRFLVEHCGFTAYALEAPFTQAHTMGAWIEGGPGDVADVAATGMAIDLGSAMTFRTSSRGCETTT